MDSGDKNVGRHSIRINEGVMRLSALVFFSRAVLALASRGPNLFADSLFDDGRTHVLWGLHWLEFGGSN